MNDSKVAILIAVRMKSKRLPKKALARIGNQTLMEHLIDRMKLCKTVDSIVLCTSTHPDDKILVDLAKKKGIGWFKGSEDDVLDRFIKAAEREKTDIISRVTGDNPLTDPHYLDKMVEKLIETHSDYIYAEGLPAGTKPEVMTVDALKKARETAFDSKQSEYMTLYFKSGFFKIEKVEAEEDVNRPDYRLTVDTQEDLDLLREISKKLRKDLKDIKLEDIIDLLDKNQHLASINKNIVSKRVEKKIINTETGPKIRIIVEK